MKNFGLTLAFLPLLLLVGCSSGPIIDDPYAKPWADVPLPKTEYLPEMDNKSAKVLVLVEANTKQVEGLDALSTLQSAIETDLRSIGVDVVDREMASKFKDELLLHIHKGSEGFSGPELAEHAVIASIDEATIGGTYREGYKDKKGKWHPAKCRYKAEVAGAIKINQLPSLVLLEQITMEDSDYESVEAKGRSCPVSKARANNMLAEAAKDAFKDIDFKLKNNFAPKGHVVERKDSDEMVIFKTTLGNVRGIKLGDEALIKQKYLYKDPLDGTKSFNYKTLAIGSIANLEGKYAWIAIEDLEENKKLEQVKLGDVAEIKYEEGGFLDQLGY